MPIRFYLYPRPSKNDEYSIRVSISIGQARYMTGIGYSCTKEAWEDGYGVKSKYVNSKGIPAMMINAMIAKIQAHFTEYEINLRKRKPDVNELKEQFEIVTEAKKGKQKSIKKTTQNVRVASSLKVKNSERKLREKNAVRILSADLSEFISEQSIACQWALATCKCWKTFTNHITKYGKNVRYEDFDEDGINRFMHFLRVKQKLNEKSTRKQYINLRWFLNWAIRKGYCNEMAITKYRPKFKIIAKPVIFLTKEELLKLYHYNIPNNGTVVKLTDMNGRKYEKVIKESNALSKTRDLFCFCAFTSLRYSDMANVRRTDVIGNTLYITTQKTNDRLPIDLNCFATAILDKYKGYEFPYGLALPVISNQKMNYYLKDLCELCEFKTPISIVDYRAGQRVEETFPKWSLVGTHAGRRTFICFALSSGIPPQVVMKWTGHSDYKAMKPYIDIAEKTKAEAMSLFEENLKK